MCSSDLPSPTPPSPSGGGGTDGDDKFSQSGKSFTCTGDTAANSIVAKYQRYVGAFPDGKFGKNTYLLGQKKADSKLPSPWENYKDSSGANNICSWLKRPGQPWANEDGKTKKENSIYNTVNKLRDFKDIDGRLFMLSSIPILFALDQYLNVINGYFYTKETYLDRKSTRLNSSH